MAVRRKGRRKTWVGGELYVWYVHEGIEGEGFWTLHVNADKDWQRQFDYPLSEIELKKLAARRQGPPLPEQFDTATMTLRDAVTKHHGPFLPATPKLVRMLVEWYLENEWFDETDGGHEGT